MKVYRCIPFLLFLLITACTQREDAFLPVPDDPEDITYSRLMDSVEARLYHPYVVDTIDAYIAPMLEFYEQDSTPHHFWMQMRCHFLMAHLETESKNLSEDAVLHYVTALKLLDAHFDPSQDKVCHYYSWIFQQLSRIIFSFSDEQCSKQLAYLGLDFALMAQDTVWIARSYSNLAKIYEGFGRPGEGDTAYFYCNKAAQYVNAENYPMEYARVSITVADCYRHSHAYDKALECFAEAKSLLDTASPLYHIACVHEAFVYFRMQDYESAIVDLELALATKDRNTRQQVAYGLSDCYERLGDTAKAAEHFLYVKSHREMENVEAKQNSNAVPMAKTYLESRKPAENKGVTPWLFVIVGVIIALAVFLLVQRSYRKKADMQREEADRQIVEVHDALKEKSLQVLVEKSKALYASKPRTAWEGILNEFHATYPDILPQLVKTYPDLTEGERNVALLSFLGFRIKEEAVLLHLSENTVMKYRSNLKKKVGFDPILALMG